MSSCSFCHSDSNSLLQKCGSCHNKDTIAAIKSHTNGLKYVENCSDSDKEQFMSVLLAAGIIIVTGGLIGFTIYYVGYGIFSCLSYIGNIIF